MSQTNKQPTNPSANPASPSKDAGASQPMSEAERLAALAGQAMHRDELNLESPEAPSEAAGVDVQLDEAVSQAAAEINSLADAEEPEAEAPAALSPEEEEIRQLKDQLIRMAAENDNLRKRAQRDLEEANKYAITNFARGLVSVLENLQRATSSISPELRAENQQVKNLAEGVEMTLKELLNVFERFGIRRIDPLGQKFDHNYHQAMQQIEDDKAEPGTVLQVLQAGYSIHDRLLQPALVNVAKRGSGEQPPQVNTEA